MHPPFEPVRDVTAGPIDHPGHLARRLARSLQRTTEPGGIKALVKHWVRRNHWQRVAGGAAIGTAVAAGLLLSGSAPTLARSIPAGVSASAVAPGAGGYWLVSSNGAVYSYAGAATYGDMAGKHLDAPIVGIVAAPDGKGYWLVAKDGGVFAFGSARFYNSLPSLRHPPSTPVVGMAVLPSASLRGLAGPAGPVGPTGPPGIAGTSGATGPQGPAGSSGAVGAAGATGPRAPLAARGPEEPPARPELRERPVPKVRRGRSARPAPLDRLVLRGLRGHRARPASPAWR